MSARRRPDRRNEWWVDFRYRHKRIRQRSPVQTKRGADQYERQLRNEYAADEAHGKNPFVESPKFSEFTERWMREYSAVHNRESFVDTKRGVFAKHLLPRFADLRLDDIRASHVASLVADLNKTLKQKSVNNILSVLHACLNSAYEWELIAGVPRFHWMRVPEHQIRVLTDEQAQGLLDATDDPFWKTVFLFFLHLGVRFGEAAALQWSEVDLNGVPPAVHINWGAARGKRGPTKTGSHRTLRLSGPLCSVLAGFPRTSELVFPRADGRVMDPASKTKALHAYCRRAGIEPIGWHIFRHTFATKMAASGVPLPALQRMLGHTTIKMTMRYVHVDQFSLFAAGDAIERALPLRFGHPVDMKPIGTLQKDVGLLPEFCSAQHKTDPLGSVTCWSG